MKHIDLFSGIGGFAYAIDKIFYEERNEHIFVDNDLFCQEVLRKHWPKAEIFGDIRKFITDSDSERIDAGEDEKKAERPEKSAQLVPDRCHKSSSDSRSKEPGRIQYRSRKKDTEIRKCDFLTGGFPCQPFSQAGLRKGTRDNRYLWPEMFKCITIFRPRWIIAENVAGLASWNEGMVLEQVCTDLEKEGYEVQPFVIPAVAVNAPHRRDRIWIIAHDSRIRSGEGPKEIRSRESVAFRNSRNDTHASSQRHEREGEARTKQAREEKRSRRDWNAAWTEVAAHLCRVDDGIPKRLDRNSRLHALGNAIVPQVAEEIFKEIKKIDVL